MRSSVRDLAFSVWGWLALPWLAGAIVLSFSAGILLGLASILLSVAFYCLMATTSCSRCGFYGTGRCGVQAWGVTLFWKKRKPGSVSRFRIRIQFVFEIVMMVAGILTYSRCTVLLPLFVAWLLLGWLVVYGPKRYHGLLHRLRERDDSSNRKLLSLPVLSNHSGR